MDNKQKAKELKEELDRLDDEKWASMYILEAFHTQMAVGYSEMAKQKEGKVFDEDKRETLKHVAVLIKIHKRLLVLGHARAKEITAEIEQIKEDSANVAADNSSEKETISNKDVLSALDGYLTKVERKLEDESQEALCGKDYKQKYDERILNGKDN